RLIYEVLWPEPTAADANGRGLVIALVLAFASAAIGVAVAINWRARAFLAVAIVLNLAYWVLGQGMGGVLTGSATDPNAGRCSPCSRSRCPRSSRRTGPSAAGRLALRRAQRWP